MANSGHDDFPAEESCVHGDEVRDRGKPATAAYA